MHKSVTRVTMEMPIYGYNCSGTQDNGHIWNWHSSAKRLLTPGLGIGKFNRFLSPFRKYSKNCMIGKHQEHEKVSQ